MKNIGQLALAAVLGSGVTLGAYHVIYRSNDANAPKLEYSNTIPVQSALYTRDAEGNLVEADFTLTAEKVMPAVVSIKSTVSAESVTRNRNYRDPFEEFFGDEFFFGPRRPQDKVGTGSGVIINAEGYIVTNNHVVGEADDVEVTLTDNRTFKAKIIGTDPSTDLAVIKIEAKNLPVLRFADSDNVRIGEWVLAVGNPLNLNSTVTAGIISAKSRSINILNQNRNLKYAVESFLQTDAAINPGNSGGALVNIQGDLIGINTAIASATGYYAGYGFAVPSNLASKVVEDLLKYGIVQRGVLGISLLSVDANTAKEYNLDVTSGVYIQEVLENSGAEKAGLKKGDVITQIEGKRIDKGSELLEAIARKRPGDKVKVKFRREGKDREITVTLKNEQGTLELAESGSNINLESLLGATFKETEDKDGVKVAEVRSGKLRTVGIRSNFIITKVDGKKVENLKDFKSIVAAKEGRGRLTIEGRYEGNDGEFTYSFSL